MTIISAYPDEWKEVRDNQRFVNCYYSFDGSFNNRGLILLSLTMLCTFHMKVTSSDGVADIKESIFVQTFEICALESRTVPQAEQPLPI